MDQHAGTGNFSSTYQILNIYLDIRYLFGKPNQYCHGLTSLAPFMRAFFVRETSDNGVEVNSTRVTITNCKKVDKGIHVFTLELILLGVHTVVI